MEQKNKVATTIDIDGEKERRERKIVTHKKWQTFCKRRAIVFFSSFCFIFCLLLLSSYKQQIINKKTDT